MAIETKNVIHAAGTVNGPNGARRSGSGFVPARTGVGVPCTISHSNTSDRVKTIVVVDGAGLPFDSTFAFIITRS